MQQLRNQGCRSTSSCNRVDCAHEDPPQHEGGLTIMSVGWSSLTFEPTDDAIEQLAEAWAWRIKDPFRPVLFSTLGDMFFARDDGAVWWLNTGTAELTRV